MGAAIALLAPAAFPRSTGTLEKIKESGVVNIGSGDASVPFSYRVLGQDALVGITTDICRRFLEAIKARPGLPKLEVPYTTATPISRIPLLQNGTIDIACSTTTNTTARQQMVDFAPSHCVANRRAAAYVLDGVQLAALIATSRNPGDYKLLSESLRQKPYGIMLRKDDPQFKDLVAQTVLGLMKSGEIEKPVCEVVHEPNSAAPHEPQLPDVWRSARCVPQPKQQGHLIALLHVGGYE